ncbi:MAG: hypothetical protein M1820_002329 [Bogoriella megaspora]|nr:MAG: hypothetical protein M1820_002329 [Bogoriella megaspora]
MVMAIEHSNCLFRGTTHALPSPSGSYIASLTSANLHIRSSRTLGLTHSFALPSALNATPRPKIRPSLLVRWSHNSKRIFFASVSSIFIFSLKDPKWRVHISNGSGGIGRISNAEFGAHEDEVLVWTEFGASMTVWDVSTGKGIEIRDPKDYQCLDVLSREEAQGWGYRPQPQYLGGDEECQRKNRNEIFAQLSRVGPKDVLSIHAPRTYGSLAKVTIPSIDAVGIKWSRDGRWIAAWETPSQGMKIWIYTADGNLYRTYSGDKEDQGEDAGLGVKSLEWSPSGEWLAVGRHDSRVTLLNTRTFAPALHLDHTPHIHLPPSNPIYIETLPSSTQSSRSYTTPPQPLTLPTASSFSNSVFTKATSTGVSSDNPPPRGISHLAFNPTSTLLATLSPAHPSTVWIWDLLRLTPCTVIIQSLPIKAISWAPNRPGLLFIQSKITEPTIFLWDTEGLPAVEDADASSEGELSGSEREKRMVQAPPQILNLPLEQKSPKDGNTALKPNTSRLAATWLTRRPDQAPAFVFGDSSTFIVVRPRGSDPKPEQDNDASQISSDIDLHTKQHVNKGPKSPKKLAKDPRSTQAPEHGRVSPDGDSEDSLFEILTGRSPVRVQRPHPPPHSHSQHSAILADEMEFGVDGEEEGQTMEIADMVDAQEGEDDFTRVEDTLAGKGLDLRGGMGGESLEDMSDIF